MVKLESLKRSNHFKKALKEKKVHSEYFSIFAAKNFFKPSYKTNLLISFVMKKKIGNAVKINLVIFFTTTERRKIQKKLQIKSLNLERKKK